MGKLKRLIREIHQRSLWQALVVYLGVSWAILEAVDVFSQHYGLPSWLFSVALVLLLVGLPVVIVASLGAEEEYGEEVPPGQEAVAAAEDRRLRRLTWRTAGQAFVAALAVWGVVLSGWVLLSGRTAGGGVEAAALDPANRIAVLPFSYRGDPEYEYLGEGMVDLLSRTLNGGELRTVDPQAVLSFLAQEGGQLDPETGRSVAVRLEAEQYIVGEVVTVGGRLQINARLHGPIGREDVLQVSVEGDPDSLYPLVDDLTAQLLVGRAGPEGVLGRVAAITTDSLRALIAFLEGERLLRAGEDYAAHDAFQRAIDIDSTFALAWYGLSRTPHSQGLGAEEAEEAEEAALRSDRLPWRERALLEANRALLWGQFEEAEGLYVELLRRYPDYVEAWIGLTRAIHQYDHIAGRLRPREACDARRRQLSYDPDDRPALINLSICALRGDGDQSVFDSVMALLFPDGRLPYMAAVWAAFAFGDSAAQVRLLEEAPERGPLTVMSAVHGLTPFYLVPDRPREALELARTVAARSDIEASTRAYAMLLTAHLELALGHWRAAQDEFDRLALIDPATAIEYRTYWSLAPFAPVRPDELRALQDSLVEERRRLVASAHLRTVVHIASFYQEQHDSVGYHLRLYLLGRLSARLGDAQAAERYAAALDTLPAWRLEGSIGQDLAQSIRAHLQVERSRTREALKALEAAPRQVPFGRAFVSPFFNEPQENFLRGDLLAELGRYDEALDWYESSKHRPLSLPLLAPQHLKRAEIYERLGETEQAAYHYARFIDIWRDCDPELRPLVESAERALERLTREPTGN